MLFPVILDDPANKKYLLSRGSTTTYILGLPAITSLQLAKHLDETVLTSPLQAEEIYRQFPTLFTGLGNLGDDYKIKLKPDAVPYALYAPRRIPLPLRAKVAEELHRMETMGVISKVKNLPHGVLGW